MTAARGEVDVFVLDAATGALLRHQRVANRVVTTGRNQIRDAVYDGTISPPIRFALGTGNTAVADGDTSLVNEIWRDVFATKSKSTASVEYKYFLTSVTANGYTLSEAGLFDAAVSGTMHARVLLDPIVKTSGIAVLFVWTLTWSAA